MKLGWKLRVPVLNRVVKNMKKMKFSQQKPAVMKAITRYAFAYSSCAWQLNFVWQSSRNYFFFPIKRLKYRIKTWLICDSESY